MLSGKTFISYAHNEQDREIARMVYRELSERGFHPWMDEKDLLPGDDFVQCIRKEIRRCRYFLALLSTRSLNKRGFVQSELRMAVEVLDTFPVNDRFIIPIRLEPCTPRHERLAQLHWLDLFPDPRSGLERLCQALEQGRAEEGGLWYYVGAQVPEDICTWDDDRLFPYIKEVLLQEARDRAQRDYLFIDEDDPQAVIRARTNEKVFEVAARAGFLDGLQRFLEKEAQRPLES